MPILHAVVLGILQGLTEFFPVSSSGHLVLAPWLFGWDDFAGQESLGKAFDVALHLGTLVGAVAYFWSDLVRLARAGLGALVDAERRRTPDTDTRTAWLLAVSVVPAVITGVTLAPLLDVLDDQIWLVAVLLIVFGLVLARADRLGGTRSADGFALRDAVLMGVGQALALQPGVSRSGVTITVARHRGFSRDAAARLSFLMSVPVIAGAGLYSAVGVLGEGGIPADFRAAFAVGMFSSAVTGWLAVWATLRLVRTRSFSVFVGYRIVLGVGVLVLLAGPWR